MSSRPVPKTAISAAVKQAKRFAETPLQKALSLYYSARDESHPATKLDSATRASLELERLEQEEEDNDDNDNNKDNTDVKLYLAMTYVELFVAQQEMLKLKTKVYLYLSTLSTLTLRIDQRSYFAK